MVQPSGGSPSSPRLLRAMNECGRQREDAEGYPFHIIKVAAVRECPPPPPTGTVAELDALTAELGRAE